MIHFPPVNSIFLTFWGGWERWGENGWLDEEREWSICYPIRSHLGRVNEESVREGGGGDGYQCGAEIFVDGIWANRARHVHYWRASFLCSYSGWKWNFIWQICPMTTTSLFPQNGRVRESAWVVARLSHYQVKSPDIPPQYAHADGLFQLHFSSHSQISGNHQWGANLLCESMTLWCEA